MDVRMFGMKILICVFGDIDGIFGIKFVLKYSEICLLKGVIVVKCYIYLLESVVYEYGVK